MEQNQQPQDERKITISFETSRNIAQYETAKFGVYLSGIPADASQGEIDEMIATAEVAFDRITVAINAKAEEERARYQAENAGLQERGIPPRNSPSTVPNTMPSSSRANYGRDPR